MVKHMRILGIDYGSSKIGLALGETDARLATPFGVIDATKDVVTHITDIITREGVSQVVVGVPYTEDLQLSVQAEQVMRFIEKLQKHVTVPVITVDERFSTAEAKRLMLEDTLVGEDDAIAAMTILQGYMDQIAT